MSSTAEQLSQEVDTAVFDTANIYRVVPLDVMAKCNRALRMFVVPLLEARENPASHADEAIGAYLEPLNVYSTEIADRLKGNFATAAQAIGRQTLLTFHNFERPRPHSVDSGPPEPYSVDVRIVASGLEPCIRTDSSFIYPAFEGMASLDEVKDAFLHTPDGVTFNPVRDVGTRTMTIPWGMLNRVVIST